MSSIILTSFRNHDHENLALGNNVSATEFRQISFDRNVERAKAGRDSLAKEHKSALATETRLGLSKETYVSSRAAHAQKRFRVGALSKRSSA